MTKLLTAMIAAGLAVGLNAAIAKDTNSATAKNWHHFQVAVKKCDALTGADKKQCMTDAGETYRASHFNCEGMAARDKAQCQQYDAQWKSASTESGESIHSGEGNAIPANPSDPTDELRNRDSAKQHGDAATALPEPQKQN